MMPPYDKLLAWERLGGKGIDDLTFEGLASSAAAWKATLAPEWPPAAKVASLVVRAG